MAQNSDENGDKIIKETVVYVVPLLKKLQDRVIELDREQSNMSNEGIRILFDGRKQGLIDAMNIVHSITQESCQ